MYFCIISFIRFYHQRRDYAWYRQEQNIHIVIQIPESCVSNWSKLEASELIVNIRMPEQPWFMGKIISKDQTDYYDISEWIHTDVRSEQSIGEDQVCCSLCFTHHQLIINKLIFIESLRLQKDVKSEQGIGEDQVYWALLCATTDLLEGGIAPHLCRSYQEKWQHDISVWCEFECKNESSKIVIIVIFD